VRSPVELNVHYKAMVLMKVAIIFNVLSGLPASSLDLDAKWPSFKFSSGCPVPVCHFGFPFYVCDH
jgi:hypothetical protein